MQALNSEICLLLYTRQNNIFCGSVSQVAQASLELTLLMRLDLLISLCCLQDAEIIGSLPKSVLGLTGVADPEDSSCPGYSKVASTCLKHHSPASSRDNDGGGWKLAGSDPWWASLLPRRILKILHLTSSSPFSLLFPLQHPGSGDKLLRDVY